MTRSKIRTSGAEGLTLSSTDVTVASGDLLFGTANKGVVVGVTSNTDVNTLDDYEEGTFTATCSNSVTLTSGKDLLSYTKVGRMVTVGGNIQIDNGQGGASVIINNLPFTVANLSEDSSYYIGAVRLYSYDVHSSALFVTAVATTNTTTMNFDQIIDDGNSTALGGDNGGSIMFTITYMAA